MTSELKSDKIVRRKIQVVGGNTVTVSLPRSWARYNKLGKEPGDEQEISMRYHPDGSLIITPININKLHHERASIHQDPPKSLHEFKRLILADFIGGIDKIQILFKTTPNNELVREIQDFVTNRLVGFDLINDGSIIEIINMTQAPQFNVSRLLEILRVQSTQMVEVCYTWFEDENVDAVQLVDRIDHLEANVDRQSNQMMRSLQLAVLNFWMAERIQLPPGEILYWSAVAKAIESVADLAVQIAHIGPIVPKEDYKTLKRHLLKFAKTTIDLYTRSVLAFINHDNEEAHLILNQERKNYDSSQKRWSMEDVTEMNTNVALVIRHLEKISSYSRKIAEATLNCSSARNAFEVMED